MSQALYRKWRPARFEDVVGQDHITRTLRRSVAADRVSHAYLFCGPRGTGKTTSARLIAKAVNCTYKDWAERPCNQCANCIAVNEGRFMDLIEIDAASNTGVDDIRDLREKINFAPSQGTFKVYIIDEVHMLSTAAFNALLKTLEEPPEHAIFVLATTEEHKVPMTIKSRCQQFNFRLLTQTEITHRLEWLVNRENLTVEAEALALIAQQGAGSIRDAESLLDQLVTAPEDAITLERVQAILGTATAVAVTDLIEAWLDRDSTRGLLLIHDALASGTDPRQFCRQVVAYLRQILLLQAAGANLPLEGTAEQKETMLAQAQRSDRHALIQAIKGFNEAALTPTSNWQPQLPLELAFIELLPDTAAPPPLPVSTTPSKQPESVAPTPIPTVPALEPDLVSETAVAPSSPKVTQLTPSSSELTLEQVRQTWPAMVNQVGQANKNLPPLLAMSKPLATEGHTIILGFDYPIFQEKFNNIPGAAEAIANAFSQLINTKCLVRPVVTSEYSVPISKKEFQALAQELGGVVREQ